MQPYTQRMASAVLDTLIVRCYPGEGGNYTLYEDDGLTEAYMQGEFATTELSYSSKEGVTEINVSPATGTYQGQPMKRSYIFELPGVDSSRKIKVNGRKAKSRYNEEISGMEVEVPLTDIRKSVKLTIK